MRAVTDSSRRSGGFTLIEVIVAMLIASMIVTVVFSGLGIAFDAWAATTRRIDALDTNRTAWRALRRQLESALPMSTVVEEGLTRTPRIGFEGGTDSVLFVTHSTFSMGPSAPARWVEWSPEEGGLRIREYDVIGPDNRPAPDPAWEEILPLGTSAVDLRFEYWGPENAANSGNVSGEWLSTWDPRDRNNLPRAVRISTTGDADPGFWMLIRLDYAQSSIEGMRVE